MSASMATVETAQRNRDARFRPEQSACSAGSGASSHLNGRTRGRWAGDPEQRFWSRVIKTEGCWLWTGCVIREGSPYGRFRFGDRQWLTHRLAWTLTNGPIPKNLYVCHRCDVPRCVRPDHLFLGTSAENSDDMFSKQRQPRPAGRQAGFMRVREMLRDRLDGDGLRAAIQITAAEIRTSSDIREIHAMSEVLMVFAERLAVMP